MASGNFTEGPCKTFIASEAIARYLRVKLSSGETAIAAATDEDIGVAEKEAYADADLHAVRLRTASGTCKMVASAAITNGATVYGAAAGKVSATPNGNVRGIALEAAAGDGSIFEVLAIGVAEAVGEILVATETLTRGDDGKTFFLDAATEFTTKLPAAAVAGLGWRCKFVVKTAPSGAAYVITEDTALDTDKIVTNGINELEVDTSDDGPYNAGHTTVSFADGVAVAGDWVEFVCDGEVFYCTGQSNADGGITLA